MKKEMKDIFLKLMFNILKIYIIYIMIYHLPKIMRIEKVEDHVANLHDKTYTHNKLKTSIKLWIILKKIT